METTISGIRARRRLFWPLITLTVAASLWFWGSKTNDRQVEDIRRVVTALCTDAKAGRDEFARSPATSPAARLAYKQLQTLLADPLNDPVTIDVSRGDASGFDDSSATHSAIISAGDRPLIGLRLRHPGDPTHIEIVGYWTP